jgi:hypothetical protein
MLDALARCNVSDGEVVDASDIPVAVTAAPLRYDDGAEQTFSPSGTTTYVELGRPTEGQWSVDQTGRFTSFWPPSYRATYELAWMVEKGTIRGLRFFDVRSGTRFNGRFLED